MSDYGKIPDLFDRYPEDHEDPRMAGKLRVGAFTKDLFHLITEWTLLELLDAPHVVITMDEGEVSVKISSPVSQEESERIKNIIGLRGQLKLMPTGSELYCQVFEDHVILCDVRTGNDWMMYPKLRALVRKLGLRPIPELRRGWTSGYKNDGISKAKRGVTSFLHPNKAIGVLARVNAGKDPDTEWPLRWKLRTDDFPDVKVLGSLKQSVANYEDKARILSGMWSGDDLQMIPRELLELTVQSRELRRIYNMDRQSVEGGMASLMPASHELISQLAATRSAFTVVEKYSTILMNVAEKIQSEIEEESEDASIPSSKTIAGIITGSIAEAMPELLDEVLRHSGVRRHPDQPVGKITDFISVASEEAVE